MESLDYYEAFGVSWISVTGKLWQNSSYSMDPFELSDSKLYGISILSLLMPYLIEAILESSLSREQNYYC